MYLTYEEYRAYGGGMDERDFALAEFVARKRLDYLTRECIGNMEQVPEAVKIAMMVIIRTNCAVGLEAQVMEPLATGFSTDGYSERYGGASERIVQMQREMCAEVRGLLYGLTDDEGMPLVYRGF